MLKFFLYLVSTYSIIVLYILSYSEASINIFSNEDASASNLHNEKEYLKSVYSASPNHHRVGRAVTVKNNVTSKNISTTNSTTGLKCEVTGLRLNLDLTRLFGKWHPVETSPNARLLWYTSLNTSLKQNVSTSKINMTNFCPTMEILPDLHDDNKISLNFTQSSTENFNVTALLISDSNHTVKSKWVISWPNGEQTLTSIVGTGSTGTELYDWLLTFDCDLNNVVDPDWAIFSRTSSLTSESLSTIHALLQGISKNKPIGNSLPDDYKCINTGLNGNSSDANIKNKTHV